MSIIEVQDVHKSYGQGSTRVAALDGVDMIVEKGEFVAVMGPSGSGKSTLLNLIGGLDTPDSGRVVIGGEDLSVMGDKSLSRLRRRRIGLVFQLFNLLPILSAEENVALPLLIDGLGEEEAMARAAAVIKLVGIENRKTHRPSELSGGEQQRVSLARALVADPVILLADEPTGNLDTAAGLKVMELLRYLCDEHEQTILMVTHDDDAAAVADRLSFLKDGLVVAE